FLILCSILTYTLLPGRLSAVCDGCDDTRQDFAFTLKPQNYIAYRVTFNSDRENNILLWRTANHTAIAHYNNYYVNLQPPPVSNPHRVERFGPWRDHDFPNAPMQAFFMSAHKDTPPNTLQKWHNSGVAVVSRNENTDPATAVVRWDDGSNGNAVYLEVSYGSN